MTDRAHISQLSSAALPGAGKRHRTERRFKLLGLGAIAISMTFLVFFLASIATQGYGAFFETAMKLDIPLESAALGLGDNPSTEELGKAKYRAVLRSTMREIFPEVSGRRDKRELYGLMGAGAEYDLRDHILADPAVVDTTIILWLTTSDVVDLYRKGGGGADPDQQTKLSDKQKAWYAALEADGQIKARFSWTFLTSSDSRDPELAGVWGAAKGTAFALFVCLLLSFFVGVLAAIYLEEFAPKNRWTDILEININNLAAVPSITFGLLGLAIFLGFFGLPRSASLVGGMVLALMTLPTIIISSRVALQAVPPSIREAALGIGASHIQAVFHHVFPLALPGMLTGTIIGMARALGETAPLLMIGMVAFIADPPQGLLDPASALPVQVYLWADSPERAFAEKTAGAIMVLLVFLVAMNMAAVMLRKKFEKRW